MSTTENITISRIEYELFVEAQVTLDLIGRMVRTMPAYQWEALVKALAVPEAAPAPTPSKLEE